MIGVVTVTFTRNGTLWVGAAVVTTFPSAETEWAKGVDQTLASYGYRRVGPWSRDLFGDYVAAVESIES